MKKNVYERYLAAQELKRREWRFHKKFAVWFKRHSTPLVMTEQYEKGDVLIFDSEATWKLKKRTNFTFEYKHLENELDI